MNYCRPCGCKGIRTCLICEKQYDIKPISHFSDNKNKKIYDFCHRCKRAWLNWDSSTEKDCSNHGEESLNVNGILVLPNFITDDEKEILLEGMNRQNWDLSQSGRRKQNYGPKCNFKKRKIQIGNFHGFPSYSKLVHDKFQALPILNGFSVIEQCSLEYDPEKGASIDPHVDDCWIWGERIVTVNVLGDTFLCLTRYNGERKKYNLDLVESYPSILNENENILKPESRHPFNFSLYDANYDDVIVRIYQPAKSLVVLYGSARYEWEHFINREDIKTLRICLAYREFTPPYLPGGEKEDIGADILKMSGEFW